MRLPSRAREFESHRLRQGLLEGIILQGVFSFYPKAEPIAIALAFLLSLSIWL